MAHKTGAGLGHDSLDRCSGMPSDNRPRTGIGALAGYRRADVFATSNSHSAGSDVPTRSSTIAPGRARAASMSSSPVKTDVSGTTTGIVMLIRPVRGPRAASRRCPCRARDRSTLAPRPARRWQRFSRFGSRPVTVEKFRACFYTITILARSSGDGPPRRNGTRPTLPPGAAESRVDRCNTGVGYRPRAIGVTASSA